MSKSFEFELNLAGLNELMKSPEMQAVTEAAGQAMAKAAGPGYTAKTHVASFVAITSVYPETDDANKDNLKNNTMLKAAQSSGLRMG
jgi:hypothetical protein